MEDLRYERPKSIPAACALLAEEHTRARAIAGGTDLMIRLRDRTLDAGMLVDIKDIAELRRIEWRPDGSLVLGSAVTMRQIYEDRTIAEKLAALAEGAEAVGSLQIRCRATIGGNICNASPCMDTAPALTLFGARARLVSAKGEREVPVDGFFLGVKRTVVAPGELCVEVVVPAAATRLASGFDKVKRVRGHDLAVVNAAVVYDAKARTLRAAIGSCAITPVLTAPVGGVDPSAAKKAAEELAARAVEAVKPIDDVRSSAEYRRDMAALLVRRLVGRLLGGTR
jgi:carbon-monoxide dehydrogenase medium subunit